MKNLHRADVATVGGLMIAATGLLLGLHFEGIGLNDIGQLTAGLIVFCGTLGAVLISVPLKQVTEALKALPAMLKMTLQRDEDVIETVIGLSRAARQRGLLKLEEELNEDTDPVLRRGLRMTIDAVGVETIRTVLDTEVAGIQQRAQSIAEVYETAAGYAPTLGVAGAAIGLIQVMKHLEHLEQVGMGVAAAFVATIYGVLLANLVLLPVATKIRARAELRMRACGLMREGILSIAAGLNPTLIRMKLEALAQIEEQPRKRVSAIGAGRAA
jgi:chemotaxis protein MotA